VDAAAVTDALQASDLERMPGPGLLRGWLASTVNTATFSVSSGQALIAKSQAINLRANGQPLLSDDAPSLEMAAAGGERIIIATAGTTGTIGQVYQFTPIEDM